MSFDSASAHAAAAAAAMASSASSSSSAAAAAPHAAASSMEDEEQGEFLADDEAVQVIEATEPADGAEEPEDGDDDMAAAAAEEEAQLTDEERKQRADDLAKTSAMATELRSMLDADDSSQGFFDHKESVFTIALSPLHPTLVLTGAGDNAAFLWDFTTGERKATLAGHTDSIIAGGFSPDGRLVATASMDATVRVYRVADGSLHRTLEGPAKELEWMEWHPLGPVLVAGSADETVWMWNGDSGECMSVFSGQGGGVTCGGWTADGKTLISCGESGDLIVWNPKSGEASVHLKDIADGPVTSFAAHPDKSQKLCITGGADGIVKVFNYETGKMLTQFRKHEDSVESVAFAPKLKLAASCSVDGKLKVWDLTNGQCRVTCAHDDAVTHLEWAPNGDPYIFSSSVDKTIKMWDVRSGECLRTWKGHSDAVLSFRVTPDAGVIVSGSDDNSALVFRR